MVHGGARLRQLPGKGYTEPIAAAAPPVYNTLLNKYYVDEGYDYVFTGRRKVGDVRLGRDGTGRSQFMVRYERDRWRRQRRGWITRLTATFSSWWDKWIIDGDRRQWPRRFWRAC